MSSLFLKIISTRIDTTSNAGVSTGKEPLIRKCSLTGDRINQILKKAEFDSDFGRQLMTQRLDETLTRTHLF